METIAENYLLLSIYMSGLLCVLLLGALIESAIKKVWEKK